MKEFNYALWLLPENYTELKKHTNNFGPHITLHENLTLEEAKRYFIIYENLLHNQKISFKNTLTYANIDDFYFTFFKCNFIYDFNINKKYKKILKQILPDNPRLSVKYKYMPFTEHERKYLSEIKLPKINTLTRMCIFNCNNHFKRWKLVKETKLKNMNEILKINNDFKN